MLLPDQTYEQANIHQDYLRPYDEFNRIIDLKEIDVKRLQRNIFDSDNGDELMVLTNNEMKFCQTSRQSGCSSVPSGTGVSGGGPESNGCCGGGGKSPGQDDTDSAIWSTREQWKSKHNNGRIVSNASVREGVSGMPGSGSPEEWRGRRGRRHQRSRRATNDSSCSSLTSDIQTDLGSDEEAEGRRENPSRGQRTNVDEQETDYDKTSDFFNNIPEFQGESLGPFSLNNKNDLNIRTNIDILRACELFLMRNRIRPDFFCKYKKVINASVSAPSSFPLSRTRTPVDSTARKPKSLSPPLHRPPSSRPNLGQTLTKPVIAATVAPAVSAAAVNAIYSVPNRAAKRRRFIVNSNTDASSSNEAVHLQQKLKSLSTELVTLRSRLHTGGQTTPATATGGPNGTVPVTSPVAVVTSTTTPNTNPQTLGGHGTTATANLTSAGTGAGGLAATTVSANGINILSHLNAANGASCNNNITNSKSHMIVAAAQCIPPTGNTLNHPVNALPIVSPRNTSIPYPLPHHNSTGTILVSDTAQCGGGGGGGITGGGTLPRRTTVGFNTKGQNLHGTTGAAGITGHHLNSTNSVGVIGGSGAGSSLTGGSINHHSVPGCRSGSSGVGTTGINGTTDSKTVKLEDLIHLPGPLTEDAVMRTLQTRFSDGKFFTNVGPILLSVNPYHDVGNPLTLSSTRSVPLAPQLRKIVQEAVRQQAETGYPQAIILSGTSGSGKTHCSMLLLRQLFAVAGGGPETDAFKHLAAAFTVLRSLGSAKTSTNSESSRIGQFIEVQVTDGALYRTKIHCYFLDQTRVIRPLPNEKNYHIFYQMLAGLNAEECTRLNLEGYSPANLRYLQNGDIRQDEQEDAARFQAWKACLGILGIPFLDVVRVLAAVLLLGNVQFVDGQGLEVEVNGETELNAVANLLGVPPAQLFRGLTIRTHNARGQLIKSVCDANMSNMTRDSLAKALYCRTVATIVRRANSLKRLGSTLGTLSSDSNESVHNQAEVASQHASTIGGGNAGSKSMAALNNAVRHATDGFIGILDMFGFEEPRPAQLEHLCINLCAETMQHFYNTHIFKSSVESCREEGIICDAEVDYVDNVPCIDLISSLRTGLLSMLDAECSVRGTAESYVAKIKVQHRNSARLEQRASEPYDPRMFAIRHFAGRVEYDTTDFLDTNRDVVPDDLVSVFYKHTCNFGFATHLFGTELKALYAQENVPRGLSFRIAPTSHTDLLNGDEPVSTLTQDFHTRLDNLLRTLVHARPHFVRCIRSNTTEKTGVFDRGTVVRQIRALQVLETVNLMASGFPHRMRFKQFTARYRMLAPFRLLRRCEEKALEDCKLILDFALENPPELDGSVTLSWAPGKRHIFLSEGIRQHLEHLRTEVRMKSATLIQATWRGWNLRKRLGTIRRSHDIKLVGSSLLAINKNNATRPPTSGPNTNANNTGTATRPRPQPIAGTPPPDPNEKCDSKIIAQTCTLFGLDLERPPPVPPSRSYTVTGNSKLGYPQTRIMKMNFPEDSAASNVGEQLRKGEAVTVTGASHRRGHLIVEHNGISLHVPFQYMELVKTTTSPAPPAASAVNI
ncbi:myosin-G heavy chain [Sabethes cyaneus]|uniref:myosin-G heavy chain n=1 Tax=Sabethes cyaneus TaxID=53552 RepID=UPI00237D86AC|nr:myosin-G heavy chain [Sabethes cyaneus]